MKLGDISFFTNDKYMVQNIVICEIGPCAGSFDSVSPMFQTFHGMPIHRPEVINRHKNSISIGWKAFVL